MPHPAPAPAQASLSAPPARRDQPRPPEQEQERERGRERAGGSTPPAAKEAAPPAPPRYPVQAVPGITALHRHTHGHPEVIIGVVDGPPDLSHPCLAGAQVEAREPWWLPSIAADDQAREHGTWTASVLAGRPGSVLPGLAPGCRLIMLNHPAGEEHVPDPHSAARAIEELVQAGASIIQYTLAHHTASHDADPMLKRAVAAAIEAGVLVTAPAGNDYGKHSIAVANLPGVLAVGAHRADGAMFFFSNHGPAYAGHGLVALGEAVYGATPGDGGIKAQKGTCVSVALVTGAAALLVSLQRHLGRPADPLAVRDALLAAARPCTTEQAHGKPERCLNGIIDLPAATRHLFGDAPPPQAAPTSATAALPTSIIATSSGLVSQSGPAHLPVSSRRDVRITTVAERPHLAPAAGEGTPRKEDHGEGAHGEGTYGEGAAGQGPQMPAFLAGDLAGRWSLHARLQDRFPQFSVVATSADGQVIARGHGVPFALALPGRGRLPDGGWDDILTWAFADTQTGTPPDTLGLLAITVQPTHRGTGLPARVLAALKDAARTAGLTHVVAPVRPTRKHHEPHTPMADYATRTRPEDGLPADPWLRTHVRAGGTIIGLAPASMTVAGSLTQWREWTGLPFDADGPVIVPGALVPVQASLTHQHAVYVEPNIWVHHPLGRPS